MPENLTIISVGGSLIVPDKVDTVFLKSFKDLIIKFIKKGKRFIIVCGGGRTARNYQEAARNLGNLRKNDIDWLGIFGTIINANLLRAVFYKFSHPKVISNPSEKIDFKEKILIASGWKPGFSTDYGTVLLTKKFKTKRIVNLTNIDYVYNKDPKKFTNAKPIEKISWTDFRRLLPRKWRPGLNSPFDPVASKEAEKAGIEVVILNGKKIKNLENYLLGKKFFGTIIK